MTDKTELLTDEEISAVLYAQPGKLTEGWFVAYARAVEAAVLRKLAEQEPILYQYRTKPAWDRYWGQWQECTKDQAEEYKAAPLVNEWQYEARALIAAPVPTSPPRP